jgi:hypothetical protein
MGSQASQESASLFGQLSKLLIHPVTITILAIPVICLWLFLSSIWIDGDPGHGGVRITASSTAFPGHQPWDTMNKSGVAHFLVRVTPFRQTQYSIEPFGMQPITDSIRFGHSLKLNYPYDFKLEHILIIKLDPTLFDSNLLDQYRIELLLDDKPISIADPFTRRNGSLLIGRRKLDLSTREREWIQTHRVVATTAEIRDILNLWRNPAVIDIDLGVGQTIEISLIHKSTGNVNYHDLYTIKDNKDGLLDELLLD